MAPEWNGTLKYSGFLHFMEGGVAYPITFFFFIRPFIAFDFTTLKCDAKQLLLLGDLEQFQPAQFRVKLFDRHFFAKSFVTW
jgi:hypothetical protein